MPNNMENLPDLIQRILDKNKGFIVMSQVAKQLPDGVKEQLGIKSNTPTKLITKKLEPLLEDRFIFRKKGLATYIVIPCDPADFVRAELSESKGIGVKTLAKKLKPFMYVDIKAIVNDLIETGEIRVLLDDRLDALLFSAGSVRREVVPEAVKSETVPPQLGEYTLTKFKAAYDELHRFREFPRIPDLRKNLNWPREVFDDMVRTLRDNMTVQLYRADESTMTKDEVQDCFFARNNLIMGTLSWND